MNDFKSFTAVDVSRTMSWFGQCRGFFQLPQLVQVRRLRRPIALPVCLIWFAIQSLFAPTTGQSAETGDQHQGVAAPMKSIQAFGVLPKNDAAENARRLQAAIDWAATSGAALFVEPTDEPYRVAGGIQLKQNVSLIGVHGPVGRGTSHPQKPQPVGSVFAITDTAKPFITVEGATQLRGIQFWYPEQSFKNPQAIIEYPPTIQVSHTTHAQGVTLSSLTFYGEYLAMDFNAPQDRPCEQILCEHCYGYSLSGTFIRIDYCYDIPRILHCHINPANSRYFNGGFPKEMIDAVMARKSFAYIVNHTDNAQIIDVFTFGTWGGVYLGPATYGQLTNFNLDCVCVGIHKLGEQAKNRNWQIGQGSIIANAGAPLADIHPIIVEGEGHTALVNVEAFSGLNPALTTIGQSEDFLLVRGTKLLTISLVGCRMRDYVSAEPVTVQNPRARIQFVGCVDKQQQFVNRVIAP